MKRIVVHDYAGYAFPVQLSRALARRGHEVLHLYCESVTAGRGDVGRRSDDASTLHIEPIRLRSNFERYAPVTRLRQEIEYGGLVARRVLAFQPDSVISGNTPLLAQHRLVRACRDAGVNAVFWQQDMLGLGVQRVLRRRSALLAATAGSAFVAIERRTLRRSDGVVAISHDFLPILERWRVPRERVDVVENWAPLDELPLTARDNAWARAHGLVDRTVVLYSGTLGLKHNPELIVALARRCRDRDDVAFVVVSQGLGARYVEEAALRENLTNVQVLPYQAYEQVPQVLASADVLVALLEPDAGVFSVPSKVLAYMCAGRAILAAVPRTNLAARMLAQTGAGQVVEPSDVAAFVAAGTRLIDSPQQRAEHGAAARRTAEQRFDIEQIASQFEAILACDSAPAPEEASLCR